MTVYSFACSTPDNWSSLYFWVKTFGPGLATTCLTGTVAIMAFRVANTQKKIATNKYKLDMFDKRWSVFEEFYDIYNDIKKAHRQNTVIYSDLAEQKTRFDKCIIKIYKVYDEISDYLLIEEYTLLLLRIKFLDTEIKEIRSERLTLISEFYTHFISEDLEEIEEIKELDNKVTERLLKKLDYFESFIGEVMNLYQDMEEKLKVPHNPY